MNNYKFKIFLIIIAICSFIFAFFYNPSIMINSVRSGLTICSSTVIPSLFPFIVLSDFLVRSGLCQNLGKMMSKITTVLFALPPSASCVIIMSLIGGFPVGPKMISQLIENGSLSKNDGKRMLLFCVNGGPAFIIGAVGTVMLSSRKAGIIIYVSLVLTSLLTGIASRFFLHRGTIFKAKEAAASDTGALVKSVSESTVAMLNISAWILLFSCVSGYITSLPLNDTTVMWINMMSEVTKGSISAVGNFPTCVLALVIGWSGFAVHCQIYPYIKTTGIKIRAFLLSRLINGGIATAVAWVLFRIFPCEVSVFSTNVQVLPSAYSISFPAAAAMLVLGGLAILDVDLARTKKV